MCIIKSPSNRVEKLFYSTKYSHYAAIEMNAVSVGFILRLFDRPAGPADRSDAEHMFSSDAMFKLKIFDTSGGKFDAIVYISLGL